MGWMAWVLFPAVQNSSGLYSVQTGSGAVPSLPSNVSPGVMQRGHEPGHTPLSVAEFNSNSALSHVPTVSSFTLLLSLPNQEAI
jgi:hypothetical protein